MTILEILFSFQDSAYADFQASLIPGLPREKLIGVRLPQLRRIAKAMEAPGAFLSALPHTYHDEDMLHALLLSDWQGYEECISLIKAFLPHIHNWAVCDSLRPKCVKPRLPEFLEEVTGFLASDRLYTRRFGVEMLMVYYPFTPDLLALPAMLPQKEYYEQMMVAWYYATALAKQWEQTIPYLERLPEPTYRKTIQKACESRRITPQQKAYLRGMTR